jgi:cytidyltransferase-like protein
MVRLGVISGGFDPLHKGHVAYIQEASLQCDHLFVGVNTDAWLERKKGRAFMPYEDRSTIVQNIVGVSEVIPFNDDDGSAFNLIEKVYDIGIELFNDIGFEVIFMNGGDRTKENIPEEIKCEEAELSCTFKFGVGGEDKKNSSSWILKEWEKPTTTRKWGTYTVLDKRDGWSVKELSFDKGAALSDQMHHNRSEHWHVVQGSIMMKLEFPGGQSDIRFVRAGESIDIPKNTWHKAINVGDGEAKVVEVWLGDVLTEDDIVRRD